MSTRIRIFRVFGLLLLILAFSMLAFADTIRLKDGSILKGKITGFASGKFTIAIGEGSRSRQMTFSASEIESIVFDSPMSAPQTAEAINRNASYKPPVDSPRVVVSDNSRTITTPPKPKADSKIPNAKPIDHPASDQPGKASRPETPCPDHLFLAEHDKDGDGRISRAEYGKYEQKVAV